jgi:phosphoenolpyruvate carboxykinase (ATP)
VAGAGEHPFAALVRDRGGLPLGAPADAPLPLGGAPFVAILARGEEISPPVARLGPWQAAAWLLLADDEAEIGDDDASAAQVLAERLAESDTPAYLLTAGRVGGADGPLSREIDAGLVSGVIDAAIAGDVVWEADPDFGYELPMELPGLEADDRRVLVPRFLYARTDRVYDYAAMVPVAQRERAARLDRIVGLATAIGDAVAPPRRRGS